MTAKPCTPSGFHPVGGGGGSFPPQTPSFPPKGKGKKEKRRKRERERERARERESERERREERGEREKERERRRERKRGKVYVFGATILYLITLRLAEYHRLKSTTPQCH